MPGAWRDQWFRRRAFSCPYELVASRQECRPHQRQGCHTTLPWAGGVWRRRGLAIPAARPGPTGVAHATPSGHIGSIGYGCSNSDNFQMSGVVSSMLLLLGSRK